MPDAKKLYRYEEFDHGEGYGPNVRVRLSAFNVIKRTPKGCWISIPFGWKPRWVSLEAKKRFAYPTKEEALKSFIARKRRQVSILSYQKERAEIALQIGKSMLEQGDFGDEPRRYSLRW